MKMKKSEEITSPASFLKKQSHIITNNAASPDYYYPTTRHEQYLIADSATSKCTEATSKARPTRQNSSRTRTSTSPRRWRSTRKGRGRRRRKGRATRRICWETSRTTTWSPFASRTRCLQSKRIARRSRRRNSGCRATISARR